MDIIGRKAERQALLDYANSGRPEFVVVYGRRRIGKTFLIRRVFGEDFDFQFTGIANSDKEELLRGFSRAILRHGGKDRIPSDWFEAFEDLRDLLESLPHAKRKIVFLDELSWMETHKSEFLRALEHFWNGWASGRDDIMLIGCGSATTWITEKLIQNKGGLYGRVTHQLWLAPFSLAECEAYFKQANILLSRYQIVEWYMIFGGIPYYLSLAAKGSLAANVDRLCYQTGGELTGEFDRLFASIFNKEAKYIEIIRILAEKRQGLSRMDILNKQKKEDGGGLTKILTDLELSGFIQKFKPFGSGKKGAIYQLTDFFSLFYLTHMAGNKDNPHYWSELAESPVRSAWCGFAFERVCLAHTRQLKEALGISHIRTSVCSWRSEGKAQPHGVQIDLVIDRADHVVDLCEMKFSDKEYYLAKDYSGKLRQKRAVFAAETQTRKALHQVLVTTYGVLENEYSAELQAVITMDDLFGE
ncbi:MAG: ATP-binding protein [Lachnospiraceae bacterium]|jgi:hypothetical protein|nr:ATP-binding protein [Lachnospiraceae bacterium]